MMNKPRLLAALKEMIFVEEGMVTLFANFDKVLVQHVDELDEERKKEITKLLSKLNRDSSRHKETIDGLIEQVRKSDRDEY
ncbi:MAG: hypothetical protein HQ594_05525 [Candidatus Omnitrophica bacterium]|nr:hypothetical protein [Candidatus Omnitrophota bacterium]